MSETKTILFERDLSGHNAIAQMLQRPLMTLMFYPFGIVRKYEGADGTSESLISPEDARRAFTGEEESWDTGLIQPDLLYRKQQGNKTLVVGFRDAQQSGIWIEGEDEPIRLPLPPLILFKVSTSAKPLDYTVFAVHRRPRTLDEPLYVAPLPNLYARGGICWGSVSRPNASEGNPANMTGDWNVLLGSGFNSHSVGYKSKKFNDDIRKMLRHVAKSGVKRYPLDDLKKAAVSTFGDAMEAML